MNKIREYRQLMGYTQTELAKLLNISQGALSGYETGRYDPDIELMQRLTQLFGVSMDELYGLSEKKDESEEYKPKTIEARIVSGGMDKLPKEQREQVLAVVRAMFSNNPDLFTEEG